MPVPRHDAAGQTIAVDDNPNVFSNELDECIRLFNADYPLDAVEHLEALEAALDVAEKNVGPNGGSNKHTIEARNRIKNTEVIRLIRLCRSEFGDLLKDIRSDETWTFFGDRKGVKTYSRIEPGTGIASFKIRGVLDADLFSALACLYETDKFVEWLPNCQHSERLDSLSQFRMNIYARIPLVWPMAPREAVLCGYGQVIEDGSVVVYIKSIHDEHDPVLAPGNKMPKDGLGKNGAVAVDLFGGFQFTALTETTTEVSIILNTNPKVAILPTRLMNYFSNSFSSRIIPLLQRQAMKFHPGGVHEHVVARNPYIYDEIRRRISGSLAKLKPHNNCREKSPPESQQQQQQQQQQLVVDEEEEEEGRGGGEGGGKQKQDGPTTTVFASTTEASTTTGGGGGGAIAATTTAATVITTASVSSSSAIGVGSIDLTV